MSAILFYSGTDNVFGYAEDAIIRQINRSYPTATWTAPVLVESDRLITEIELRHIEVPHERIRAIPEQYGDTKEQALILEFMHQSFDVAMNDVRIVGCSVKNMSRGHLSHKYMRYVFRDALLVADGKIIDDLVEEDMLGNLLFVSINNQIVGFAETFKKFKRRTKVAGKGPFGGSGLATKHYRIECNNLTFDLECLEEESETLLLEDRGRGVTAAFVYGKPHKHTACPHDCLGLKLTEIGTYLEKFVSATMTTEEEWIQDYILKGGMMVIEKSKFSWVEQCVMSDNSWDKNAPREVGNKTRFVSPILPGTRLPEDIVNRYAEFRRM